MSAAFVGLTVSVKLKDPPTSLSGLVSAVNGQRLYLTNVHFNRSGKRLNEYTIHGSEIADIEVLPDPNSTPTSLQNPGPSDGLAKGHGQIRPSEPSTHRLVPLNPAQQALHGSGVRTIQNLSQLSDPAILSFAKTRLDSNPNIDSGAYQLTRSADINAAYQSNERPLLEPNALPPASHGVSATLAKPLDYLAPSVSLEQQKISSEPVDEVEAPRNFESAPVDAVLPTPNDQLKASTKRRKRGKAKHPQEQIVAKDLDTSPEAVQKRLQSPLSGWRQTPILQQEPTPAAHTIPTTVEASRGKLARNQNGPSTKKSRRQRELERESANGWATEDAGDVQGLGDFDFEANLSKFDKLAVWDELRNGDTTADEDRLVSLNRVKPPAPGTFGGKKLLPSENVLDRPRLNSRDLNSDDGDDHFEQALLPRRLRKDVSKISLKQPGSRKESVDMETNLTAPLHANQRNLTSRSLSQVKASDSHSAASPRMQAITSPDSSVYSPAAPDNRSEPCLRYITTERVCRTMTPETLEAVENLAHNGFGMSEDIIAESAGRSIAEVALSAISPKGHRLGLPNHNSLPVVVILVGDNKAGGRALAAARHLLERSVRVVAALTGAVDLENGPLSSQIHRFRGKFLRTWQETSAYLKTLDAPPELIIDGLLGVHSDFDDLEHDHLLTAMQMVAWANKSKARVLAVDIPSGVDSSTGEVKVREGEPAEVRVKIIVCCGVPCSGLLQAMLSRDDEDGWKIYIADIGLNPAARPFLRVNTNKSESHGRGRYIQFGSGWIVEARYDSGNII